MEKYEVRVSFGRYCAVACECATEEEAQLLVKFFWSVWDVLKSVPMAVEWSRKVPEDAAAAPEVQ